MRAAVKRMPGITDVAKISNGVAVRGKTFGQCIDAVRALKVTWNPGTVDKESDKTFLVMPNKENTGVDIGGHHDLMVSHPIYWTPKREPGQPLTEQHQKYGKVYHLGSPADLFAMAKAENAIINMPHPRAKGSTEQRRREVRSTTPERRDAAIRRTADVSRYDRDGAALNQRSQQSPRPARRLRKIGCCAAMLSVSDDEFGGIDIHRPASIDRERLGQ